MNIQEIPLNANNERFSIQLGRIMLKMRLLYRDTAGWVLDIMDSDGNLKVAGIPLISGTDLIEQYPDLGVEGCLVILCDKDAPEYPTKNNLGSTSRLYFVSN